MTDHALKFNKPNWNKMVREIVDTECVKRMERVADASNRPLDLDVGQKGYMVSVEGDEPLTKRDYRATVITAGAAAVIDNAHNDSLIKNFHLAGGT